MGSEEEKVVAIKRAEIDTRAPFRSVKEAVSLFGEKVLGGEIYANKLKEIQVGGASENGTHGPSRLGTMAAELEETKQSLETAREESTIMANCIFSLREELERTKRELKKMKEREIEKQPRNDVMESTDVGNVMVVHEDSTEYCMEPNTTRPLTMSHESEMPNNVGGSVLEFQKKRYVTFANPPSLTQVINVGPARLGTVETLERHPSLRKTKKKKPLIPLIGGLFNKKKLASHEFA